MKRKTYNIVTTTSLVVLVASAVLGQRFGQYGIAFGCLAVLSAAASFIAYVKALPKDPPRVEDMTQREDGPRPEEHEEHLAALADTERLWGGNRPQYLMATADLLAADAYTPILSRYRAHYIRALHGALKLDEDEDAIKFTNYVRLSAHPEPVEDPATLIVNVVQKLCATSQEPKFEFVLAPDGTFKIKQVSVKKVSDPVITSEASGKQTLVH